MLTSKQKEIFLKSIYSILETNKYILYSNTIYFAYYQARDQDAIIVTTKQEGSANKLQKNEKEKYKTTIIFKRSNNLLKMQEKQEKLLR